MKAFNVSTWDEVLAIFDEGELAGKWGWLEVLRRANDCDSVIGTSDENGSTWETGRIYIGPNGEITIGGESQIEFAARFNSYSLDSAVHGEYHFATDANTMYWHVRPVRDARPLRERTEDLEALGYDGMSILLDVAAAFTAPAAPLAVLIQLNQVLLDLDQFAEAMTNLLSVPETHSFTSDDVLGAVGWIPEFGSVPDLLGVISHLTGVKLVVSP